MSEEMGLGEIQVTEEDVQKQMEGLDVRKAPGPDGVSGWILKECNQQLTWVIHNIIESSLIESRVPIEWKRANIVPIYKGGSKEEPLNYRPVSVTSVVCKICERLMKDKTMQYLEGNEVIIKQQFGLRRGRSCVTNLLGFYYSGGYNARKMDGLTVFI